MKITNAQLIQIIKEELEKVLEEESTARMARQNPDLYSKERESLVNKLINGEISLQDIGKLDDTQLELLNQKIADLSQAAFSSGVDIYSAYNAPEYAVMQAIEQELKKRRNQKGSQFHTMDGNYSL